MTEPHDHDSRASLPIWQLVTLSIYWFGIVIIWGGLNKIILPAMIEDQPGGAANLGILLAILVTVGVIAPILVQPTVGMISDYTVTRWGRRKPYIFIGALLDVVFLFGIATSQTYLSLVAFYFLLQLSSNFAQGPFQGYVPDLVPKRQVGLASGLMGTMIVLGTIAGVGIATFGVNTGSLFLATMALGVVELVTMVVLVTTVHEGTAAPRRTQSWLGVARSAWSTDILRESSVLWLLVVRLLFLGAYAATSLALPYFQRAHGMSAAEASTTVFIGTAIVGVMTAIAAIPGAPDLRPRRAQAGHLGSRGDRGNRPPRSWPCADAGGRDRRVRAVRDRHGCVPVGRLGADDRRHPEAHLGPVHGHPQCRNRDGRAAVPDRRGSPRAGPPRSHPRRVGRGAIDDARRGPLPRRFRARALPRGCAPPRVG